MKRWLSMLLALCMVWAMLIPAALAEPIPEAESEMEEAEEAVFTEGAAAQEAEEAEAAQEAGEEAELQATVNYAVTGGYLFFDPSTGAVTGHSGDITSAKIPAQIYDIAVTRIGNNALSGCTTLSSVTIPDSVTSIGNYAFRNCSGLKSMTIPNSVTSIGNYAFSGCTGLKSMAIPDSVTTIGENAFSGCAALTSVTIPNSVTSIGIYAFQNCTGLKSVTIPGRVTSISNYAFYGCTNLKSVTIPNSVTSIGNYAFYNCSNLTSVTIPNSVTTIGEDAFYGCVALASITIPNSVTRIYSYAFSGCRALADVYYTGTITEWGQVNINNDGNTPLLTASLHFGPLDTPTPTPTPTKKPTPTRAPTPTPYPTPKLISATASTDTIKVTWNAVSGVKNYRVYRKTASTSWKTVATTTKTSYTDKKVTAGTKYIYTVRCMSSDGKTVLSDYNSKGVSAKVTPAPTLIGTMANNTAVIVVWDAVPGVTKYRVYRKTASTDWKKLADTSGTFYGDTSAVKGTTYTYTVRCLSNDGQSVISLYNTTGVTGTRRSS